MKKIITILMMLFLSIGLNATNGIPLNSKTTSLVNFEPGETVYIEIPGFEASQATSLKNHLTSPEVGAVWLGYCESFRVICIKFPAIGQEVLENHLKEITGGFKILSASQVSYSITDACFNND